MSLKLGPDKRTLVAAAAATAASSSHTFASTQANNPASTSNHHGRQRLEYDLVTPSGNCPGMGDSTSSTSSGISTT